VTPLLLALDLGGTDLRATVIDAAGARVAAAAAPAPVVVDVPPMGRRYDPDRLWQAAASAIREVLAEVGRDGGGEIAGVAATGQRLACAFLDEAGETVYVGPNTDARGIFCGWQVEEAAGGQLYDRTGRSMPLLFAPARLLWFRENAPEEYARVARVVGLGDWLAQRLCGQAGIDLSGAVELLLVDVYRGDYWGDLWTRLELDPSWVPPPSEAGAALGALSSAAAQATGLPTGIPVAVCPPDSMAAILGSGSCAPGSTLILAGSTMPVLASAERPVADPTRRTWTGRHPVGGLGVNESNAGTTGFSWAWIAEQLVGEVAGLSGDAAYARAEEMVRRSPVGACEALAFCGGASVMDATRMGTFLTRMVSAMWPPPYIRPDASGAALIRSCLESIAYSARANLEQAEAARGGPAGPMVLAGGMSRSDLFTQMIADVVGRPVARPRLRDATGLGAAMCAAVAGGVHQDLEQARAAMTGMDTPVEPDPSTAGAYGQAYREWLAMYEKIQTL
jgi:autoinducer 2 (AI-2) kinase